MLKLDNRLDLKLHAFVLDEDQKVIKTMRVKSILSDEEGQELEVFQEILTGITEFAEKVGFLNDEWETPTAILQFFCNATTTGLNEKYSALNNVSTDITEDQEQEDGTTTTKQYRKYSDEWNLLYTNYFDVDLLKNVFRIKYVLSIECMDSSAREIFLEKPQLSLLRIILDYYFKDYFQLDEGQELILNENTDLENQYMENHVQFLQRMVRIFFGKAQDFISKGSNLNDMINEDEDEDLSNIVTNQYYINNLLEKIDGISTRTYEGANPFGCMLILGEGLLGNLELINYSIRFENTHPINLEDARRIRKLLELTNSENDLYLIADDEFIYGIGKVNWDFVQDNMIFKIEFKGISKYDLVLVTVEERKQLDASVVIEQESKILKMTTSFEIVSRKLCSIAFKNPGIGSGEFSSELFERTMRTEFKEENPEITDEQIETLRMVIKKATEQQSGTMVVITSVKTAEDELKKLKKQSTAIIPTEISPEFIKHLTSIDGAIYFDITGNCHAIGVILDGLADENLGDASRGARFHSAYRYLEKLKKYEKGKKACVIAIISEDGMVNLIPEQANEAVVRQLVVEMIGYIKKKRGSDDPSIEQEILESERRLEIIAGEKAIDHHHYFKIADVFFEELLYLEASKYYTRGLKGSNRFIIRYVRDLALSFLRYAASLPKQDENKLPMYNEALTQFNLLIENSSESELMSNDYNCRAISLHRIGEWENKKELFNLALLDFDKALELQKIGIRYVMYTNRGSLHKTMGNPELALNDFISAEIEKSRVKQIKWIELLIKSDSHLFIQAIDRYTEIKGSNKDIANLEEVLKKMGSETFTNHPDVTASLEKSGLISITDYAETQGVEL